MDPLNIIRGFDPELYDFFQKELDLQRISLSFIPDENTTSPLSAGILGSIITNTSGVSQYNRDGIEHIAERRICELFKAEHANIRSITIEAASRVVFQSLTRRGDVVMSLDLRKQEHCNSENMAYRFFNFGLDPNTQRLDYDAIDAQAKVCKPQLIILSPINYPLEIDYARFAEIASRSGALLWCDISQIAGLIAGGSMNSPLPFADVVTFSAHGSMQGPQCAVILCKRALAGAIDSMAIKANHQGLPLGQLAALAARIKEMQDPSYQAYTAAVLENSKALASGLQEGGLKLVGGGTQTHLTIADTRHCSVSARGAQELLSDAGVRVRICSIQDPGSTQRYDAVRFSTLPLTTRGVSADKLHNLGLLISKFLIKPDQAHAAALKKSVSDIAMGLPVYANSFVPEALRPSLSDADGQALVQMYNRAHQGHLRSLGRLIAESRAKNR